MPPINTPPPPASCVSGLFRSNRLIPITVASRAAVCDVA
jgi:hypothetical protein